MPGRASLAIQAMFELGPQAIGYYALYHIGLKTGLWHTLTPSTTLPTITSTDIFYPCPLPERSQLLTVIGGEADKLIIEADEICNRQVRLFGGAASQLKLSSSSLLFHWTEYERRHNLLETQDVKLIWEAGRFGWVFTLARAFLLTGNEKYPQTFWQYFEEFVNSNPPYQGPHWISSQEVALRLMALLFAHHAFATSPASMPIRQNQLIAAVITHARRIPPTLSYALAQNNNHLLSESLGLYLAGICLPEWKKSKDWRDKGWRIFHYGIKKQIGSDGTYIQHSTNYHRLMLQAALWLYAVSKKMGQQFPPNSMERLALATRWMIAQMDLNTGRVPNLGHQDGSYILPLSSGGHLDYRPVAQAAARAFLGETILPPGYWDEFSLWLNLPLDPSASVQSKITSPAIHRLGDEDSWATLRAVHYSNRPAHADQLHVDMWWKGENTAMDAGTFSYNLPPPWNNMLSQTAVHNTVTIDGQDQMRHAGRFLWLNRAQAQMLPQTHPNCLTAEHYGYRHLGILHQRQLIRVNSEHWQVIDMILPIKSHRAIHQATIHWLLPDWQWELCNRTLTLISTKGKLTLQIDSTDLSSDNHTQMPEDFRLMRGGQVLVGCSDTSPLMGWYSPTYFQKFPMLSLKVTFEAAVPFSILSDWIFSSKI